MDFLSETGTYIVLLNLINPTVLNFIHFGTMDIWYNGSSDISFKKVYEVSERR